MSDSPKERTIETQLVTMKVSYVCPKCRSRETDSFCYQAKSTRKWGKHVTFMKQRWCSRCREQHSIHYSMEESKKDKIQFNLIKFETPSNTDTPNQFRPRFYF